MNKYRKLHVYNFDIQLISKHCSGWVGTYSTNIFYNPGQCIFYKLASWMWFNAIKDQYLLISNSSSDGQYALFIILMLFILFPPMDSYEREGRFIRMIGSIDSILLKFSWSIFRLGNVMSTNLWRTCLVLLKSICISDALHY